MYYSWADREFCLGESVAEAGSLETEVSSMVELKNMVHI